ncbi:hypothetical protein CCY99_04520 [Helicobacter sp. 16-1353]|uniref:hypothetical protein n=1 Tax=Helicobacter sp. 16-1353 TaxID=2004996 RepID=UPI000DCDC98F|nr:hypothetical protein [Helicobacter sp. 16-1353]RAX54281.1 hypothetical protein CCY99_04520 [Helicobacter sp. 16-1353]
MLFLFTQSLYTQDKIIDTSKILKNNQALVIDAKTNTINYVLEMLPNGKIIKKYLTIQEQEQIKNQLDLKNIESNIFNNRIHKKSNISEWNKKKIPYEQKIEKIDIDR